MTDLEVTRYRRGIQKRVALLCREPESSEQLVAELQRMAAETEILLSQDTGDRSLIDCGPGCGDCCVVNVSTLIPEGIAIVRYLRELDDAQYQAIAARLESLWNDVRGLDDEDRIYIQRPCAFLDKNGCCLIYPVRPLLCRSITSTDAGQCRESMTRKVFGENAPIVINLFQQQLYESQFSGFAAGLEEGGIDGRSFQVSGLVRLLLNKPELERDLLDGHRLSWEELF